MLEVHLLWVGLGGDGAELLPLLGREGQQSLGAQLGVQLLVDVPLVELAYLLSEASAREEAEGLPQLYEAEELVKAPGARVVQIQDVKHDSAGRKFVVCLPARSPLHLLL